MITNLSSASDTKYFLKQFSFPEEFASLPKAKVKGDLRDIVLHLRENKNVNLQILKPYQVEEIYNIPAETLQNYKNFLQVSTGKIRMLVFTDLPGGDIAKFYHAILPKNFWSNLTKSGLLDEDEDVSYIFRSLTSDLHIANDDNVIPVADEFVNENIPQENTSHLDSIIKSQDIPDEFLHYTKNKIKHALEFYMSDKDYTLHKFQLKDDKELEKAKNNLNKIDKLQQVYDYINSLEQNDKKETDKEQLDNIIENIDNIAEDQDIELSEKSILALDINKIMKKLSHHKSLFYKFVKFLEKLNKKQVIKANINSTIKEFLNLKNKGISR